MNFTLPHKNIFLTKKRKKALKTIYIKSLSNIMGTNFSTKNMKYQNNMKLIY